jgi:hypothetical protein
MRHAGRLSIISGALSWILLASALIYGGLGPTVAVTWELRAMSGGAAALAFVGTLLSLFALARGPQRISAAIGLMLSGTFLLLFTASFLSLVKS